jgi:hypothetical protein
MAKQECGDVLQSLKLMCSTKYSVVICGMGWQVTWQGGPGRLILTLSSSIYCTVSTLRNGLAGDGVGQAG